MRSLRAGRAVGSVELLPIVLLEPPVALLPVDGLVELDEPLVDGLALELESVLDGLVVLELDELPLGLVDELLLGLVVDELPVEGLALEPVDGVVVVVVVVDVEPEVDGLVVVVELLDDGLVDEPLLLDGADAASLLEGLVVELDDPLVEGLVVEPDELDEGLDVELLVSLLEPVLPLVLGDVVDDDEPVVPLPLGLVVPPVPMPGEDAPAPGGAVVDDPLLLLWA